MTDRAEYVAGLRQLADMLEQDDGLPLPTTDKIEWYVFGSGELTGGQKLAGDAQKALAADIVRRIPGEHRKWETGDLFRFTGSVRALRTEVIVDRAAVCRRVVKGTREVVQKVPAPDAPMLEVTRTVEDVEWVCEPLLAEGAVS